METKDGIQAFHARTNEEWRAWLKENAQSEKAVLLIMYHKNSNTPSVPYHESIEEALCYGWIDSKANKRDDESSYLCFTPRKPKSIWSKINKDRVEKMTGKGLMTPAGQALIDLAKKTGTWDAMTDAENAVIPDDLQKLFDKNEVAFKHFSKFAPSSKRMILQWILSAKRPETRQSRVEQTVALAAQNIKVK